MVHIRIRILSLLVVVMGVLVGLTIAVVQAPPAHADDPDPDDFRFRSMHVDYELGRDDDGVSTLRVTETLVAEFPEFDQNRGIRREIPERYLDLPTRPTVVSITDESGERRAFEHESDGGFLVLTIADDAYVHGEQTYVITYTMQNVTRYFADTGVDEFYWNVNGTGWSQPFGEVSMTLRADPSIASAMTGARSCYRGAYGEADPCDIRDAGGVVEASGKNLARGENVTVAVAFDAGTFRLPDGSYFGNTASFVQVGAAAVAVAGLGVAAFTRRRRLADAPGLPVVIAQYTPPADYDAWESAVLLGKANGATAELLEQAVRGSIRLVEEENARGRKKLRAELLDPALAGDRDGAALLTAMFGAGAEPGARFTLGKPDQTFAGDVAAAQQQIAADQKAGGVRKVVPAGVRLVPIVIAAIGAIATLVCVFLIDGTTATKAVAFGLLGVALIAVVTTCIVVAKRPYSERGAVVRDHLAGLEQFMRWAEADRIRMLQSPEGAERVDVSVDDPRQMLKLYEPLLPYAVIFSLEKQWSDALGTYYSSSETEPSWFVGPGPFNSTLLASSLASTSSAMSSSSTSGGSSGGGFSGGGGGGGGGGGV